MLKSYTSNHIFQHEHFLSINTQEDGETPLLTAVAVFSSIGLLSNCPPPFSPTSGSVEEPPDPSESSGFLFSVESVLDELEGELDVVGG